MLFSQRFVETCVQSLKFPWTGIALASPLFSSLFLCVALCALFNDDLFQGNRDVELLFHCFNITISDLIERTLALVFVR